MRFWKRSKRRTKAREEYPIIQASLQDVRNAVLQFEMKLDESIKRTILLKEDQSIDFTMIAPYLEGIPDRPFYMSRETYEIFEEEDRMIPVYLDIVQKAVDLYIEEMNNFPVNKGDPYRKINIQMLMRHNYLKEEPSMDFYLTDEENLITHKKP